MKAKIKDKGIEKILKKVGNVADEMNVECYVVGGFVRDLLLGERNDDIDFVVVGSGLELAKKLAEVNNTEACLYESYGTAKVKVDGYELEFVGARREFYHRESRNPIVEDGTLEDDLSRRDFTINAMAICVNGDRFGELIDKYGGQGDLKRQVVCCVGNPTERFSEDPLRMLRCVRFASRFGFNIDSKTYFAIISEAPRIDIIVRERVVEELMKMMSGDNPYTAFMYLHASGLMELIIPSLYLHDDYNFIVKYIELLKNVTEITNDVWVRWSVLMKPLTTLTIEVTFKKLGLPLDGRLERVKKLSSSLSDRFVSFIENGYNKNNIRRFLYESGNEIEGIMKIGELLYLSDKTIGFDELDKIDRARRAIIELDEKEHMSDFCLTIDGSDIMSELNLKPCQEVGIVKAHLIEEILDGNLRNDRETLINYLKKYKQKD